MTCALLARLRIPVTLVVALVRPLPVRSQAPPLPGSPSAPLRTPTISVAQPADGVAIPQDRLTLAFRFVAADAADPLDLGSLRVVVDGRDATTRFHITPNEAWGTIDPLPASATSMVTAGMHVVSARICSLRGACGAVTAMVNVSAVTQPVEAPPNAAKTPPGPHGLIGALAKLARKLVGP